MKNAIKHRNPTPPTIHLVVCPDCDKPRLRKYEDEDGVAVEVDTTTVDVRDEIRHLDACSFCVEKYRKADERFVMANMDKLSKAFAGPDATPDTDSDHKDFSLN